MSSLRSRSTREVLEDHLRCRREGDLDGDLSNNYSPNVVLLSAGGVHHGHDGVRHLAGILGHYLPDGRYHYRQLLTEASVGMLNWTGGRPGDPVVHDGVDTFVVRDGQIEAQTIHYSSQ